MTRLKILAPERYPWTFNGPRHSRHIIERRAFLPLNRFSTKLEGITIFNPLPFRRFDLTHAFNRIPLERHPFIISFELHLPRAYGLEETAYFQHLRKILAGPRCLAIVAISEHAREIFKQTHQSSPYGAELLNKLTLRYPNVPIPESHHTFAGNTTEHITVAFVGNHFGRKGGCVAVELAQLALSAGFPLIVEIVSSLEVGGAIWTDPVSKSFFDRYFALLDLPNVRWHRTLDNPAVLELFRRSHFSLLATFGDTFGYTAIESLAHGTPVIATRQGALTEFISHRENGILLDLPTSPVGEWVHSSSPHRADKRFESIFAEEVSRLAKQAFEEIVLAVKERDALLEMRRRARETAVRMFDGHSASEFWDEFYVRVLAESSPKQVCQ